MISFLQHQAMVGDTCSQRDMLHLWANGDFVSVASFTSIRLNPAAAKPMSEAAGEICFENFRLKFPGDLVINTGI